MKSPLGDIIGVFVITLALLALYSFSNSHFSVFGVEMKKSGIKGAFLFEPKLLFVNNYDDGNYKLLDPRVSTYIDQDSILPVDTTSKKILLIGDSMIEGIMKRLKNYTCFNHHDLRTVIWYSSSTKWFGRSDTLSYFIKDYKPNYIIMVLGANELFIRDIKNRRIKYVRRILKELSDIPFVWVGPPNWTDDTGINDMLISSVGNKRFFESRKLYFDRTSDGAHPTRESAAVWTDSICSWIMKKSAYPIKMELPDSTCDMSANVTLLQPQ